MKVIARLRDTRNGYVREYVDDHYDADFLVDTILYMWSEGNYSCDCNRSLFLYELDFAYDERDPDWTSQHLPCGDSTIILESLTVDGVEVMNWSEP